MQFLGRSRSRGHQVTAMPVALNQSREHSLFTRFRVRTQRTITGLNPVAKNSAHQHFNSSSNWLYSKETLRDRGLRTSTENANEAISRLRQININIQTRGIWSSLFKSSAPDSLDPSLIAYLCVQTIDIFSKEERVVKVDAPCLVFGDIHGNLKDLVTFEDTFWGQNMAPSHIFLGDFVDRGAFGVEVAAFLLALKILNPLKFFMVRGNHEVRIIQKKYTFYQECLQKYGADLGEHIWESLNKAFDVMPVAAVVAESVFCAHGGIPTRPVLIADIEAQLPTPLADPEQQSAAAVELMWNDPLDAEKIEKRAKKKRNNSGVNSGVSPFPGFFPNPRRGANIFYFNEDAVNTFLGLNHFSYIIRAHEMVPKGFKWFFDQKVVSVFSSSRYCGKNNRAAAILVDADRLQVINIDT